MGLLTTASAFAPAAMADDAAAPTATTDPTATAPATTSTGPTTVLTPTPTTTATDTPTSETPATSTATMPAVPASPTATADPQPAVVPATTPTGAHYGTGKLSVGLVSSEDLPGDDWLDDTGAQVRLDFTGGTGAGTSTTCTFTDGDCIFPVTPGIPNQPFFPGLPPQVVLPADSQFTLTLTDGPTSRQLLLDPASPQVIRGYTSSTDTSPIVYPYGILFTAPHGYRQLGIAGGRAGEEFRLCTIADSDSDCVSEDEGDLGGDVLTLGSLDEDPFATVTTDSAGNATFPGAYRPGTYTLFRSSAPTVPLTLEVGTATSLAERDTAVRLQLSTPPVTTPAAPTTPTTPTPSAPATGTPATKSVAVASIAPGKTQTVSIGGFKPNEMVHGVLHSTPVDLGTVQADGNGVATFTFAVPAGFEAGVHTVEMTGLTSGITAEATFTVTAAASASGGGLAYTGTDVLPLLAVGGGLLAAGAAAVTVAARRRSA